MEKQTSDQHDSGDDAMGESTDPLLDLLAPTSKRVGEIPKAIKRYRIKKLLGEGSFGQVFLGHDDQLQRDVAIKVPSGKFLSDPSRTADYLNEARTIAGLDHPNIIPVYDVGSTYDFPIYIVTKYIKGQSLAQRINSKRLSLQQTISITSCIANALHFAHRKGVIHRDVKPENILIDDDGKPYLVDLGLALSEKIAPLESGIIGTPAYMSPEQARGEGHRVDGRTDIYSLGVVLYELLLDRRPFSANTTQELLEQISNTEPKPLRQINDAIPKQLERICLKAIARLAKERYTTARDFAEDLQDFLEEEADLAKSSGELSRSIGRSSKSSVHRTRREESTVEPVATNTVKVIPKGPQSFDGHDADFFLELLPGPYDRRGIPESIRFWKTGIEKRESAFPVGLIYGPSGAGKSSFLQAGLIPLLEEQINVCFIQASADHLEASLLTALKQAHPKLPAPLPLADSIKTLRRADHHSRGGKTLIVLDQFEQWLAHHIHRPNLHCSELVQALRQCDGENVQCLISIRDDFWMAITDFFAQIEVELVNGQNTRSIERFDLQHAQAVLHRFGVAFGKLPENRFDLTASQELFLQRAVSEFAVNGRVACVAIALLAEMLKHSEWSGDTIQKIGGMRGLGLAYLEQYFDGPQAPPQNRIHEAAVRQVLRDLLPIEDSDIKGTAKTKADLIRSASYQDEPEKSIQLFQIMESHLITATEKIADSREVKYQLAHDFFVPAIRDWIASSKQKTAKGRADLLMEQRTRNWKIKPENQRLPGPFEFAKLVRHTSRAGLTDSSRSMMDSAWKYYLKRTLIAVGLSVLVAASASWFYSDLIGKQAVSKAETLVASLYAAPDEAVPYVLSNLADSKPAREILLADFQTSTIAKKKLRAALALSQVGNPDFDFLLQELSTATSEDAQHIVNAIGDRPTPAVLNRLDERLESESELPAIARLTLLRAKLTSLEELQSGLKILPDSTFRSQLIVSFSDWDNNWNNVLQHISDTQDRGLLTGLIQALALVDPSRVPQPDREPLIDEVQKHYMNSPDALVHSSCKSLLKKWAADLPSLIGKPLPKNSQWQETRNGITLIKLEAGKYNRDFLNRGKSEMIIKTGFWMSDEEINSRLFWDYASDPNVAPENKPFDLSYLRRHYDDSYIPNTPNKNQEFTFTAEHPVHRIYASDAINFCNWLSRREGLTPAYRRGKKIREIDIYRRNETRSVHAWEILESADGYRLPGHYEFDYARNGGSSERFPFGDDYLLAKHFCVFSPSGINLKRAGCETSASRLPNPFGLFDICGNLSELTHSAMFPQEFDPVDSVAPHFPSWETNEKNYTTAGLPLHSRLPTLIAKGGFRVVRIVTD